MFTSLALPLNDPVGLLAFAGWLLLIIRASEGDRSGLPVVGADGRVELTAYASSSAR